MCSSRSRAGQKLSAANHLCSPTLLTVVPRWSPHTTPAAGSLTDRSADEQPSLSWKPPEEMGEASRARRYPRHLLCGGLELVAFIRQQLAAVEAEAQQNRPDNGPVSRWFGNSGQGVGVFYPVGDSQKAMELQGSNARHLWWSEGIRAQQHHAISTMTRPQTAVIPVMAYVHHKHAEEHHHELEWCELF